MQAAALLAFGPVEPSHLIVVDDEADLRTLLAGYFSRQGYRVSAVASGRELLERMTEDPANVVLLDLGLPAEDGFAMGVAEVLNKWSVTNKIDELLVIAAPKTLGELRKHWHKDLQGKLVGEIAKDLTGHSSDQIASAIEKA